MVDSDGVIKDKSTLLLFNYRSDRMRQIAQVFGKVGGELPFEPKQERVDLHITSMTQYKGEFPFPVLFPPQKMTNVLSEVISAVKLP